MKKSTLVFAIVPPMLIFGCFFTYRSVFKPHKSGFESTNTIVGQFQNIPEFQQEQARAEHLFMTTELKLNENQISQIHKILSDFDSQAMTQPKPHALEKEMKSSITQILGSKGSEKYWSFKTKARQEFDKRIMAMLPPAPPATK